MDVILLPEILDYFNDLTTLLYKKDYFGFEESALNYVDNLVDNIKSTLDIRTHKAAPNYFNRYGKNLNFASFRTNKNTEWYVFFNIAKFRGEYVYVVRYITNNHVSAHLLSTL